MNHAISDESPPRTISELKALRESIPRSRSRQQRQRSNKPRNRFDSLERNVRQLAWKTPTDRMTLAHPRNVHSASSGSSLDSSPPALDRATLREIISEITSAGSECALSIDGRGRLELRSFTGQISDNAARIANRHVGAIIAHLLRYEKCSECRVGQRAILARQTTVRCSSCGQRLRISKHKSGLGK